jgi:hypothetical protein
MTKLSSTPRSAPTAAPDPTRGGAPSAPTAAELIAKDEGLRPDGLVKKGLKRWANGQFERVVDKVADAHDLSPAERDRLRGALTETKDAKLREYWQRRAPLEAAAFTTRSLAATAVLLGVGAVAPAALIPAAIGVGVGLGGQAIVGHEMLGHALEGRAALEVARIERARGEAPAEGGWLTRTARKLAGGVERRAAETFGLDPAQRTELASTLEDARIQKQREILERKAPMELANLALTATAAIGACVGLGVVGPAAAVVMGASAVAAGVASAALSLWKFRAALEGSAAAQVEDQAARTPEGSPLRERVEAARGKRDRIGPKEAARVTDEFATRFSLDPEEKRVLGALLRRVAAQKEKELLGERLAPTVATPLGRGAAVATIAATAAASPTLAASVAITSVAESAISTALLYKQIDSALEGAAYGYVKTLRRRALTAQAAAQVSMVGEPAPQG